MQMESLIGVLFMVIKVIEYRTKDHPQANGRKAQPGEQQWIIRFPIEDGTELVVRMGKQGRDTFYGMLIAEDTEDEREQK